MAHITITYKEKRKPSPAIISITDQSSYMYFGINFVSFHRIQPTPDSFVVEGLNEC